MQQDGVVVRGEEGEEQHQTVLETLHPRVHKPELCLAHHTSLAPFPNSGWRVVLFEAVAGVAAARTLHLPSAFLHQEHLLVSLSLKPPDEVGSGKTENGF